MRLPCKGSLLLLVLAIACTPAQQEKACSDNAECGQDQYCSKTSGSCGSSGTCKAAPSVCTQIHDPVCGCDGTTYPNECEANRARVNVLKTGMCPVVPPPPTVCTTSAQCGQADYCAKAPGACGAEGACAARPELCAQVFDPVCGCDGTTFPNSCEANKAGISIVSKGTCTPPPQAAGCMVNSECSTAEYCAKAKGACSAAGACAARPQACISLWMPVTGCDGKSYGNSCEAALQGVNVQ